MQKSIIASLLAIAALAPAAAFASDGAITVNGSVTSQTCTINGGVPNFTVALPKVSAGALSTDGQRAGVTAFTVNLTNCTAGDGRVRALFETGATTNSATGRLMNSTATGSAGNVEVAIGFAHGSFFPIGHTSTGVPIAADGSATLKYTAQYVATGGAVTAGAVTTSVTYTLVFQ